MRRVRGGRPWSSRPTSTNRKKYVPGRNGSARAAEEADQDSRLGPSPDPPALDNGKEVPTFEYQTVLFPPQPFLTETQALMATAEPTPPSSSPETGHYLSPPPPPQTPGFHHITLVTTKARRSAAFYGDVLGLDLVHEETGGSPEVSYRMVFGRNGGQPGSLVEILEQPQASPGSFGVGGVHHLALGVPDVEAQLRWKRRLRDLGISVSGPYDRGYFHSIYFRDPDGHLLELATRGPGYAIDEPAEALGQRLIQPDPRRLPGGRDEAAILSRVHPEPVAEIDPSMALEGIHHITGITDDLKAMGAFLEGVLGLRLVKKTLNQDDGRTLHYFWARYDGAEVAPASCLTLFGWPGSRRKARPGSGQALSVAFRGGDQEAFWRWRTHLQSFGVDAAPDGPDRSFPRRLSLRAPDGLAVELVFSPRADTSSL